MAHEKRINLKNYVPQSREQISGGIAENIEAYIKSFDAVFGLAIQSYEKLQEENQKTDLRYVYICFLRSSVSQKLPLLRISLYNEAEFEDMEDCYVDWDVHFSKQLYSRLYKVHEALSEDKVNNDLAEKYWHEESGLFFEVLKIHLPKIIDAHRQGLPQNVQWRYGEYLDRCELISRG